MSRHLLAIGFAQVQGFIEAARTLRDLWKGSQLYSGFSALAAQALSSSGATVELVYPVLDTQRLAAELPGRNQPSDTNDEPAAVTAAGLPNKLLAIVDTLQPGELVDNVQAAVRAGLRDEAQAMLLRLGRQACGAELLAGIDQPALLQQLQDLVELHAAWVPWPDDKPYAEALSQLQALMGARKRSRIYSQPHDTDAHPTGLLSSLDGRRASVLVPGRADALRERFNIPPHEELDAPALLKRVGNREQGFPSIVRIALQPWLGQLPADTVQAIARPMRTLVQQGHATRYRVDSTFTLPSRPSGPSGGVPTKVDNPLHTLPFDGELLLASRRRVLRDAVSQTPSVKEILSALDELESALGIHSAPDDDEGLYVAVLVADGDHMGQLLRQPALRDEDHRRLSQALAVHAAGCSAWFAQAGGALVYAGGDDVLGVCPADGALALARRLADAFADKLHNALPPSLQNPQALPTLSVGIACGHVLQPLGDLRRLAAQALALAKHGPDGAGLRNALGLIVAPRGGTPVSVAGRWDEDWGDEAQRGLDRRLALWQAAFASEVLSRNAGYDLGQLARQAPPNALALEARRLAARRHDAGGTAAAADDNGLAPRCAAAIGQRLTAAQTLPRSAYAALAREWYASRWLHGQSKAALALPPYDQTNQMTQP